MTVRERILRIRLSDRISHQPEFAEQIGVRAADTQNRHNSFEKKSATKKGDYNEKNKLE